jgi:protein phosphatase
VRRVNEDAVLDRPDLGLWAVADGLGGHQAGDVASRMVVDGLSTLPQSPDLCAWLGAARSQLLLVNDKLNERSWERTGGTPGSTVAALFAVETRAAVLWAGDSRVYLHRDGELRRLSSDHSQAEEMVRSGLLSRRDAASHPASSVLTRAVGADEGLTLDEVITDVRIGDFFLLCSDGLYNEVSEKTIGQVLMNSDCRSAADRLLELALDGGGRDNISVVTVQVTQDLDDSTKTVINPVFSRRTAARGT